MLLCDYYDRWSRTGHVHMMNCREASSSPPSTSTSSPDEELAKTEPNPRGVNSEEQRTATSSLTVPLTPCTHRISNFLSLALFLPGASLPTAHALGPTSKAKASCSPNPTQPNPPPTLPCAPALVLLASCDLACRTTVRPPSTPGAALSPSVTT